MLNVPLDRSRAASAASMDQVPMARLVAERNRLVVRRNIPLVPAVPVSTSANNLNE